MIYDEDMPPGGCGILAILVLVIVVVVWELMS